MSEHYASGHWSVSDGSADEFISRWRELLSWTRDDHPGLEDATLIRSTSDPNRFVSFATWASTDARDAWQQSEGFNERFAACRELCDDFVGGSYERAVTI